MESQPPVIQARMFFVLNIFPEARGADFRSQGSRLRKEMLLARQGKLESTPGHFVVSFGLQEVLKLHAAVLGGEERGAPEILGQLSGLVNPRFMKGLGPQSHPVSHV